MFTLNCFKSKEKQSRHSLFSAGEGAGSGGLQLLCSGKWSPQDLPVLLGDGTPQQLAASALACQVRHWHQQAAPPAGGRGWNHQRPLLCCKRPRCYFLLSQGAFFNTKKKLLLLRVSDIEVKVFTFILVTSTTNKDQMCYLLFFFISGFSAVVLPSIEDSGPGGDSLLHLRGWEVYRRCCHGVFSRHVLWKASQVSLKVGKKACVLKSRGFVWCPDAGVFHRYWPVIDDALRTAAFDRKVQIRMLISCGLSSDPAMLPFLQSLASMDYPERQISIQIVRRSTEKSAQYLLNDSNITVDLL